MKSCRLRVSKADLATILDGRKKKRKRKKKKGSCWSGMNPIVSLVTEVEVATEAAVEASKTTEETGLMDRQ